MDWHSSIQGFKAYLQLERSMSENTIDSYIHDIVKLTQFLDYTQQKTGAEKLELSHLQDFLMWITELGISQRSQARIISGIKAFYKYLLLENLTENNPSELLESPKLSRKLPDFLTLDEMETLYLTVDHSTPEGIRDRAMIEVIYGCGLRVTELTELKISNLFLEVEFIRVIGKGDKERLIPIGNEAIKFIHIYKENVRSHIAVKPGNEDFLFLNRPIHHNFQNWKS